MLKEKLSGLNASGELSGLDARYPLGKPDSGQRVL